MTKYRDLTGQKFGRLLVLKIADVRLKEGKRSRLTWLCQCGCGNITAVMGHSLTKGDKKSCGCWCTENKQRWKTNDPFITSAKSIFRQRYNDGSLIFEDFYRLSQLPCHYCGIEPKQNYNLFNVGRNKEQSLQSTRDAGLFIHNGLDRVDNAKGHTIDNVVPCCKTCNYAKRNMPLDEFLEWVRRIFNHSLNK